MSNLAITPQDLEFNSAFAVIDWSAPCASAAEIEELGGRALAAAMREYSLDGRKTVPAGPFARVNAELASFRSLL